MGKRGPKPVPKAILKARGSWRGRPDEGDVSPAAGSLDCPPTLTGVAKATWEALAPKLAACGLFTAVDAQTLQLYCRLWQEMQTTLDVLRDEGVTHEIRSEDGELKAVYASPRLKALATIGPQLDKLATKLGLSPSDRRHLKAEKAGEDEAAKAKRFNIA